MKKKLDEMNMNDLAVYATNIEGGKINLTNGQMKEAIKIINMCIAKSSPLLSKMIKNGEMNNKKMMRKV